MTMLSRERVVTPRAAPDPARTLDTLATAIVILITISVLFLAREILVPIAIAVLLSFVLSPPVKLLRRLGLGKVVSVGAAVLLAFLVAVTAGFLLTKQITDLAAQAPQYQAAVTQKLNFARGLMADSPWIEKVNTLATYLTRSAPQEVEKPKPKPSPEGASKTKQAPSASEKPTLVEVVTPPPDVLTILQKVGGAAASPLVTAAFVALFIIFILLQREDLRNRFIRLVGFGDLNKTTVAMNEAASRLSRYFLAQVLLNMGFGAVAAVVLTIIGVPSAILWGIVAAFMRFIPYLGSIGAAFFPVLMAAAASSGWSMAVETAVALVLMEIVTGQVIEPLVFGANTGISPIAVVLSATFWTWLWGPVGLVLSTPLTVCLVVMGRHVERFAFLDVILGDAPPLTPAEAFYQRMLVGDPSEIVDHAEEFLKGHSLLAYCDKVAMKALLLAQEDVRRGVLEDERQARICDTIRDLVDDLAELDRPSTGVDVNEIQDAPAAPVDGTEDTIKEPVEPTIPKEVIGEAWKRKDAVFCVAGRTPLDEAAAHILGDLLSQHGIGTQVESAQSLIKNTLFANLERKPELVILSFLDADLSVAQARFAVRRIRRRLPDTQLVAAFWMAEEDDARTKALCSDVRCDSCVASLPRAITLCLERAADGVAADGGDQAHPIKTDVKQSQGASEADRSKADAA